MYQLIKEGTSSNVPVQEFVCDKEADVYELPNAPLGSSCFCLENKVVYMKGTDTSKGINGWIKI